MLLVPFNVTVDGVRFRPDAFDRSIVERGPKLSVVDERGRPAGRVVALENRGDGLYVSLEGVDPGARIELKTKPIRQDGDDVVEASLRQIVAARPRTTQNEAQALVAALNNEGNRTCLPTSRT